MLLLSHKVVSNSGYKDCSRSGSSCLYYISVAAKSLQSCPTLCDYISVFSNSCPLSWWCYLTISSSATPFFAFNLSQHQSLFQWVGCSHQVAKVLELQLQSFQWIFRVDFLWDWQVWSLQSKGLSRVFSSTTVLKHQFFGAQSSL